jgi:FkbM family methyltransferase
MPSFLVDYNRLILASLWNDHSDNYDARRFGSELPDRPHNIRSLASRAVSRLLAGIGLVRIRVVVSSIESSMRFILPILPELEWLYAHLADQESRDLLVSLIAFRVLGHQKVKLACNRPAYWANIRRMEEHARDAESMDSSFMQWRLHKMDLRPFGVPVTLFTLPAGASTMFVEEQYRCVGADGPIEAADGDVVIDAGACWGDTALYFAARVGTLGRVFSFEFLPANLQIFHRNLDLNPHLKDRVSLVEHAVWSSSDQTLFINGNGPATRVELAPSVPDAPGIKTLSIDDLVASRGLDRLDFIKMDIEGAEMSALRGAEAALRRFRPKLAITVYHSLSDFWSVPQFLDALGLGYRFFLRHFTIHAEETVLFAEPVGLGKPPYVRQIPEFASPATPQAPSR